VGACLRARAALKPLGYLDLAWIATERGRDAAHRHDGVRRLQRLARVRRQHADRRQVRAATSPTWTGAR